jgi:type IX secretion system substrate protein
MQKALLPLFLLLISVSLLMAQSKSHEAAFYNKTVKDGISHVPAVEGAIEAAGDTLYTFPLQGVGTDSPLNLGVTIYNDTVIVSSGGWSSATIPDNMFFRYTLDGTFIDSVAQNGTAGWGYRDLAFDGTYILGSDNTEIRKFDPTTLAFVSSVTNAGNNPHRGMAYDAGEDAIYTTNFTSGPLLKIDASTGTTLRNYGSPSVAPYGIALDPFTNPGTMDLWYAEPSTSGTFRLSKVDTATGAVTFSFDLSGIFPYSSGGLEIINNHPVYPGKIIAVALVQADPVDLIAFIDITVAGTPKAPTDVTASIVPTEIDVDLTWVDPTEDLAGTALTVDSVVVYRNGMWLGSVAAGVQSYSDVGVPAGVSTYSVIAWYNDSPSSEAFSNSVAAGAQLFDDFTAGAGGWTITNDGGTCDWAIADVSGYTLPAEATGNCLSADADACGSGSTLLSTATLAAPVDMSMYGTVMLEFDSDWQAIDADDFGYVDVSNDGTTWVNYLTYDVVDVRNTHVSLDISATAAGQAQVWVRFKTVQPGWDWWWAVDNVGLYGSGVVPVELTSFAASVSETGVTLSWATATETNNSGFSIERSVDNVDFNSIAFVDGMGTTSEKTSYNYVDNSVSAAKAYYRLKQIDFDGTSAYSNVVEVDLNVPTDFSISQNYPNPFNPSTTIKFGLPVEAKVTINLFNTLGEKVAQLANSDFAAGNQRIDFNASNLSSGVYFYTIEAVGVDGTNFVSSKKMMLMK